LPWLLAVAIVARDIIVLSLFPILAKRGMPRLEVNFTGKTATACLLFGLTWLAISETSFGVADIGDVVGLTFVIAGAVLYWAAGAMYAREAVRRLKDLSGGTA
jgi:cardiolipin synthase